VIKLKITKEKIIICLPVLFLILGISICSCFYKRNETGLSIDEYRKREWEREEREKKIEYDKRLEEYLKNKKSPSEYFSLFEKGKIYFAAYPDFSYSDDRNVLLEAEMINNVPVLRQLEFINGKKIKFTDLVLDEQFDNPDLPDILSERYKCDCDFMFFRRFSDSKENLDNVSAYIKFLEEGGVMKIWASYDRNAYGGYEPKSLDEILTTFSNPKKEIQYTGKYVYEKIEIIKKFNRSDPNYTPKAGTKEIYITYSDLKNLIMYKDNDSEWRYIVIEDINNPSIGLFAADGGGNSSHEYIYFRNDYLIYHIEHHIYDMETESLKTSVEYEMYYKKQ
jgi:hypothetical protein